MKSKDWINIAVMIAAFVVNYFLKVNVIFIIRKFFGVILLAMAINMFVNNILEIIHQVPR